MESDRQEQLFLKAASSGELHTLNGCSLSALSEETRWAALQFAAYNGHANVLQKLLEADGGDDLLRKLLGADRDPDKDGISKGTSPLHLAVKEGHLEGVRVILGVLCEKIPLHKYIDAATKWFEGVIEVAVKCGHAQIVELLLALVPVIPISTLPWHLAAYQGDSDTLTVLLLKKLPNLNSSFSPQSRG